MISARSWDCVPDLDPLVELPGIEPSAKSRVSCEYAEFTTRNDAKVRETTCGYAKGVDAVNTPKPSPPLLTDPRGPVAGATEPAPNRPSGLL